MGKKTAASVNAPASDLEGLIEANDFNRFGSQVCGMWSA